MTIRDFRTLSARKTDKGIPNPIEKLLFSFYAELSHRRIISRSNNPEKLNAKIISVGNITFGGSGKTPFVEYMARHCTQKGIRTGIALSGYLGKASKSGALVCDGMEIKSDIETAGDEAIMLARNLRDSNIPIYAHRNRIYAARELISKFECKIVILDDAFHFVSIKKDADILLVNACNPFGNGMLREPLRAMKRADCVVITNRNLIDEKKYSEIETRIRNLPFNGLITSSSYNPSRIECVGGSDVDLKKTHQLKVIPLSGIGNPIGFEKSLESLGLKFHEPIRFNDHHPYTEKDAAVISQIIFDDKLDGIITTPKDWVRLEKVSSSIKGGIFVLHSKIQIENDFLEWINQKIKSPKSD